MTAVDALHPRLERALRELPAPYLAHLAHTAHQAQCRTCREETCPTGAALALGAAPDRSWIPDHPNGA